MKHEIQHVPLKFDQKEIRKLQETDPLYAKLVKNINVRNEICKGNYSLDSHEVQ